MGLECFPLQFHGASGLQLFAGSVLLTAYLIWKIEGRLSNIRQYESHNIIINHAICTL